MSAPQNQGTSNPQNEDWDCDFGKEENVEQAMMHWSEIKDDDAVWDYYQIRLDQDILLRYAVCLDHGVINIRTGNGDAGEDKDKKDERGYSLDLSESSKITLSTTLFDIVKGIFMKNKVDKLRWVNFCNISNETVREYVESVLPTKVNRNGDRVYTISPNSKEWDFVVRQNPYIQTVENFIKEFRQDTGRDVFIREITLAGKPMGEGHVDQNLIIDLQYK